jgi:hypothetical protein
MTDETADRAHEAAESRTGLYLGAILVEVVVVLLLWAVGRVFGP